MKVTDLNVGDEVDVSAKNDCPPYDFRGVIIGIDSRGEWGNTIYVVRDQDDDVFEVDVDQISFREE